jgi:hypothetical protein
VRFLRVKNNNITGFERYGNPKTRETEINNHWVVSEIMIPLLMNTYGRKRKITIHMRW